jgi:hypothetical protein
MRIEPPVAHPPRAWSCGQRRGGVAKHRMALVAEAEIVGLRSPERMIGGGRPEHRWPGRGLVTPARGLDVSRQFMRGEVAGRRGLPAL